MKTMRRCESWKPIEVDWMHERRWTRYEATKIRIQNEENNHDEHNIMRARIEVKKLTRRGNSIARGKGGRKKHATHALNFT